MFHVARVPVAHLQWLRRSRRQISSGHAASHAAGEFEQNQGTHEENEDHPRWAEHTSKRALPSWELDLGVLGSRGIAFDQKSARLEATLRRNSSVSQRRLLGIPKSRSSKALQTVSGSGSSAAARRPIGVRDTFAPPVLAIFLTECLSDVLVEELLWRVEPCLDIAEVHFWLASIDVNPGIRRNAHPGNDLEWGADLRFGNASLVHARPLQPFSILYRS